MQGREGFLGHVLSEVHLNALKKFLSLIHIIVVYLEIAGLNRKFSLYTVIQKLPLIYYGTNNFTFSTMYTLKARHYVLHAVFFTFFYGTDKENLFNKQVGASFIGNFFL